VFNTIPAFSIISYFYSETNLNKMKNTLLLLLVVFGIGAANAQDASKVFSNPTLVWFGVDFTQAKMVGMKDESPHKIRDEYFKPWCDAVNNEIDLGKAFQKKGLVKVLAGVFKSNLTRETETLSADDAKDLSAEAIAARVKGISTEQKKEGLAAVAIVQSFNKTTQEADVLIVFFDIATHNVLLTKKVTGKASGGNTKTAFTAALKDVFSKIEKKEFATWKKDAHF